MGLYQDQTNSLSEIKRLAVLVMDDSRREEIGADQWPLAMIAYGLVTCNEESRFAEGVSIYREFASFCAPETRQRCILQLAEFVKQRQGNGWRALLPFATADEDEAIRKQAAFLIGTLAAPLNDKPFPGFEALADLICAPLIPGQQHNAPLLDAILGTADLRLMPHVERVAKQLPSDKLAELISLSSMQPNALSCEWLLNVLTDQPSLADVIAKAFVSCAPRANEILDVIVPIPSWAFKNAAVQPLHGWSRPEYFERMKPRLSGLVSGDQLAAIDRAWSA